MQKGITCIILFKKLSDMTLISFKSAFVPILCKEKNKENKEDGLGHHPVKGFVSSRVGSHSRM
jgi:hypothetical protein